MSKTYQRSKPDFHITKKSVKNLKMVKSNKPKRIREYEND